MKSCDTLIIGAGITGLNLAQALKHKRKSIIILEKSRGLGGRIATRRIEDLSFNHGLPLWPEGIESDEITKRYGSPESIGLNSLIKKMAEGLEIEKLKRAHKISKRLNQWEVTTDDGDIFYSQELVITAPLPQALELLQQNNFSIPEILSDIKYSKRLLSLMVLKSEFKIPDINFGDHHLRLVGKSGLIFMASEIFSETHFEESDADQLSHLNLLIKNLLGIDLNPVTQEIKKWRYAQAKKFLLEPFIELEPSLFLIGDAFSAPGVQGSLESSNALAQHFA